MPSARQEDSLNGYMDKENKIDIPQERSAHRFDSRDPWMFGYSDELIQNEQRAFGVNPF